MHKTTFKIDQDRKNNLKKKLYKSQQIKRKNQEYEIFLKIIKQIRNQTRKRHMQTMYNRSFNNFRED